MQIISNGGNLHEELKPIFWKKKKKKKNISNGSNLHEESTPIF